MSDSNSNSNKEVFNMPIVSVITTSYNAANLIDIAIKSILAQKFKAFEMIIVDDGSSDNTKEIVNNNYDKRIKYFKVDHLGRPKALNYAINKSKGKYIAILDADDVAFPERLSLQTKFMENNPHIGLVGSAKRKIIDSNGNITGDDESTSYTDSEIKQALLNSNPLFHSSVMFRREIFEKVNGYDERLPCWVDWDFYIRISPFCKLANMKEYLSYKRIHDEQKFQGLNGIFKTKKSLKAAAFINYRSVLYLGAPKRRLIRAIKYYIKSYL